MSALLAACGGFLLAVLWMDLIFDTQVLGAPREDGALPEPVLASIAAYYRRATTDSYPMSRLIAAVMGVAVLGSAWALFAGGGALMLRLAAVTILVPPVALALTRIVPSAARLGGRRDEPAVQTALARAICRDHLVCLASIAAFLAIELALAGG
ncbi:MAG: hypothetical protein ACHQ6T_14850 [Myxococcota bacterium]